MEKLKLGILFGGQSGEHEVSLNSAASIINEIDKTKYDIIPIGIDKEGKWFIFLGEVSDIKNGSWKEKAIPALLPPDPGYKCVITYDNGKETRYYLDVIFPVLHGPRGEDGTVQGLLELMNIPYVGCGVTSSALCMDKVFTKKILSQEGIPVVDYKVFYKKDLPHRISEMISDVERSFGFPCFVKPANLGSSVGISKAVNGDGLKSSLEFAAEYDKKILVEKFIPNREIECSVIGNEEPKASLPGEILPSREFYDYEAKYLDGGKSKLLLPAPLASKETEKIRSLAVKAYKALDCSGMARVDFLLNKVTGIIYVNEINTIPGFTKISMFPKMWDITGITYKDLLNELIQLALEQHELKNSLKMTI